MRILLALHRIIQPGGIINYTEHLAAGLQEEGHEVQFKELVYAPQVRDRNWQAYEMERGEGTGHPLNQKQGWSLPASAQIPYYYQTQIDDWKRYANTFDLVVWLVSVPTRNRENRGNAAWPLLYDLETTQVSIIHDGNIDRTYPWVSMVADKISHFFCVHGAASGAVANYPISSSWLGNPMPHLLDHDSCSWGLRKKGFFAAHNFKAFKRTEDLVRAVQHLPEHYAKYLGGGGIEYHYMSSETKVKDKYKDDGVPIWQTALEHGLEYLNYLNSDRTNHYLGAMRVHIDPQWSPKLSALGSHFNRTTMEAIRMGALPVGHEMGIGRDVFVPGVDYLAFPDNPSPEEYADFIVGANSIDEESYERIMASGMDTYHHFFDRRSVAQRMLAVEPDPNPKGEWSRYVTDRTDYVWEDHFCHGK